MHSVTKRARAILCLLLAGLTQIASAADIPSNASGDYVGDGWSCRILAYAHQSPGSNILDLTCTGADNETRVGALTVYGCPQAAIGTVAQLAPVNRGAAAVSATIASYAPYQFAFTIGSQTIELDRVQVIASPRPYAGCGASTNVPPWPPLPNPFAGLCPAWDPYCGAL